MELQSKEPRDEEALFTQFNLFQMQWRGRRAYRRIFNNFRRRLYGCQGSFTR